MFGQGLANPENRNKPAPDPDFEDCFGFLDLSVAFDNVPLSKTATGTWKDQPEHHATAGLSRRREDVPRSIRFAGQRQKAQRTSSVGQDHGYAALSAYDQKALNSKLKDYEQDPRFERF